MAEQQLQFGDQSTADIKLQLICTDGAEYQKNPLYLHFQVLKKSEFFETLLSERWCSEKPPIEINITSTHIAHIYIKCIQLMYYSYAGKRFCFLNVEEALAILPVASELLFHQCLEECMRYLNAVRWSTKQEVKLRALLLSLEINTLPDLAARLDMNPHHGGLQTLEQSLPKMLSSISSGSYAYRDYIGEYIAAHFEANSSFAETCRSALLKEFSANIERVKSDKNAIPYACYALLWIVNVIQHCDGEVPETVLMMFYEDAEIPNAELFNAVSRSRNSTDLVIDLIIWFLTALGGGRIITSTSLRVSFLTNWVPILVRLQVSCSHWNTLERTFIDVAETLPLAEQRRIYNIWKYAFKANYKFSSVTVTIESWGKKVEEAMLHRNIFFDRTGSMY